MTASCDQSWLALLLLLLVARAAGGPGASQHAALFPTSQGRTPPPSAFSP
jgi:hypothetical protein